MNNKANNAVAYIRRSKASTDRTVSIEVQTARVCAYIAEQGWQVADIVIDDGISGAKRSRFARIREAVARTKAVAVVAYHLDRFARDAAALLDEVGALARRGCEVHVVGRGRIETRTASGFLSTSIEGVMAEHYRRTIAEKTRDALAVRREQGRRVGELPFGYRCEASGLLVADQSEQAVLDRIADLRGAGLSLRAIADRLNEQGFTTRTGGRWRKQYVARLVQREPVPVMAAAA